MPAPEKPVFIIGHWRTGSTLLHQLMCLDNQFVTPSVFQVTVPDCFISIEKYYKPVMRKMMDTTRPMDNVKFGPDAPQEDEFALFRLTLRSPLQRVVFPHRSRYFLTDDNHFLNNRSESERWERAMMYFYRKLSFRNNKRVLIKNPFHSMRLKTLMKLFPDAVFIHIYRNPLDVIPSTIRMWNIIARQNWMNKKWSGPSVEEVVRLYNLMLHRIEEDMTHVGPNRFAAVKYEELERDTVGVIRNLYQQLNLNFTDSFLVAMQSFMEQEKDFKKNVHTLGADEVDIIRKHMSWFMKAHDYMPK